ncbi:MAG: PTS sugar transporter subunit IIA [Rhodospirillales bacterium]|jgi:PTS system nitrogen regulatory IIA component|nr:PTS sugar transporter subunit IIA [Rhodospirillales bacterium]
MDIDMFLTPDRVMLGLNAVSKADLLQHLARCAAPAAGVVASAIAAALTAREQLGSTGLGRGFALPHARIVGVSRFVGLFARLAAPVPFDAIDKAPVDLVFLLLIPGEASDGHLAALAAISRRMRDERVAAGLRAVGSADDAYRMLAKAQPPE